MLIRTRFALLAVVALVLPACAPSQADRSALQQGYTNYSLRQFESAQAAASAYLKKNPTAPNVDEAYYLRGLARYSLGDKNGAAEDFRAAIAKSKRNDLRQKAYRALADWQYELPHWQEALDDYEKSVTFAPGQKPDARTAYRIGACLQGLGQWDKAQEYFQRVASINTDPLLTQWAVARMNARNFSLQFGAFKDAGKAAELIKQLKTAGINPAATSELRDGQLLFLVRSGTYSDWQEATAARERLLPKYPLVTVVP